MFCRNCGTELKDDALFCTSCGMKLNEETTKESLLSGAENLFAGTDSTNMTGKEFVLGWNSYYFFQFFQKTENIRTITLEQNCLTIIKPGLTNKPKLVKTIDYANIRSVECVKKMHIKIRAVSFSFLSFIIGIIIGTGDISLAEGVLAFLFAFVLPCYICSSQKPINLLITEKNGKKTKLMAQKEYAETADEAVRCINLMIGR